MSEHLTTVVRWARCEPFSPLSNQQVLEYLHFKHYPIPTHRTTKQPTTNMESLQKMLTKIEDPVLEGVLEARHLKKAEGYLTDKYVGRDGRIHPLYTTLPQTGRLSSRRPNLQNLPQGRGSEVMKQAVDYIRGSFVADDGYVLAEMDWRAIEALLVGWFAGDEAYMEASKKGVHDIFGSHLLFMDGLLEKPKTPWDEDLSSWIEWFKKEHKGVRDKAKKRIHAGAYGQGPFNMARDLGIPVAEVRKLDKVFASMAPKVIEWQESTRRRAHAEGRLTNPFGFCVSPDTRILTADLEWKPAKKLLIGESLLALEEERLPGRRARWYSPSVVTSTGLMKRETVLVALSNGDAVVTTTDHPWLASQCATSGKWIWCEASRLRKGQKVLKALPTWETLQTRQAGWLAGLFDGEGHWSVLNKTAQNKSHVLAMSQNPGLVLHEAIRVARHFGFSINVDNRKAKCSTLRINGKLADKLRFLGELRPIRLLQKLNFATLGEVQSYEDVRVSSVTNLGMREIVSLSTSSRTYFAEGYAMHNTLPFFHVMEKRDGEWVLGREASECLAFLPQSTGAAMLREVLVDLGDHPEEGDTFQLLIPTHDSITFQVLEGEVDRIIRLVQASMEREWPQLGGLKVETETKVGKRMNEMEVWRG